MQPLVSTRWIFLKVSLRTLHLSCGHFQFDFRQIQEFWRQLAWPDLFSAYNFVMTIIDIITSSSLYFSDLVQQKLHDSGYYEDTGTFKVSDEMCISVNDLEYVRRFLNTVGTSLSVESILDAVESTCSENPSQWRDALYGLLEETKLNLEARALQIMSKMGTKVGHTHCPFSFCKCADLVLLLLHVFVHFS